MSKVAQLGCVLASVASALAMWYRGRTLQAEHRLAEEREDQVFWREVGEWIEESQVPLQAEEPNNPQVVTVSTQAEMFNLTTAMFWHTALGWKVRHD